MGINWRPRRTSQYPLHSGPKKQLKTRNAVSPDMSREIKIIYGNYVRAPFLRLREIARGCASLHRVPH